MIRVFKSDIVPSSLTNTNRYDGDDVQRQLDQDQHQKCYLCERKLVTDYEEEHKHSQTNCIEKKTDWNNLFLACGYCNRRKSSKFDNIVSPSLINVEDIISQRIDYSNKRVLFYSQEHNLSISETIRLLNRLFNGKDGLRIYKEEKFFEYFISKMNSFNKSIDDYLEKPTDYNESVIQELLDINQEFLGFKYWIIMDNPILKNKFSKYCVWNKSE